MRNRPRRHASIRFSQRLTDAERVICKGRLAAIKEAHPEAFGQQLVKTRTAVVCYDIGRVVEREGSIGDLILYVERDGEAHTWMLRKREQMGLKKNMQQLDVRTLLWAEGVQAA